MKIKINNVDTLVIRNTNNLSPVILWLHGGGYYLGSNKMVYFSRAMNLCKKFNATLIVPNYTLAKKAPYPKAFLEIVGVLKYIVKNHKELNIDINKLAVGGESAGGGLAIALAMYARDYNIADIKFIMPIYPMIDNLETCSNKNNKSPVWNTRRNKRAWEIYLRNGYDKYATPARETNYLLPPVITFVGSIDPFLDETKTFVENVRKCGVEAIIHIYDNCFHAFDMLMPFKKISKKAIKQFESDYLYFSNKYFK